MQKRNANILLISEILVVGGLLAPTLMAAREAWHIHRSQRDVTTDNRTAQAADARTDFVRLLHFDHNQDSVISREEMLDKRLHPLFDRADTDGDNALNPKEISALYHRYNSESSTCAAGGSAPTPGK